MSDELKPCPFCGGAPDMLDAMSESWALCTSCHASGPARNRPVAAAKAWNTSATEDALRAQLGEVVALLRKLRVNHPTKSWGPDRRMLKQMSTGAETCALWDGVDAFLARVKGVEDD